MGSQICSATMDAQKRELVVHGSPLFPVGCYHDDISEQTVPWHWHEELEAVVVTTGAAEVSAGGERRTVRQGEGFFINSGILHSVWPAEPGECRLHSLVFHPRLVGGSLDSIFWQGYLEPLLSDADRNRICWLDSAMPWHQEALEAVENGWQACANELPGYEFTVREALSRLIFLLVDHCPVTPKKLSEKAVRDAKRIKTMLQYIGSNYGEALTTADIARCAAISESECLRCFRAMVGTTPIQYVKQLRIQKAAELLAGSQEKIADIGALCGFQEMSYFAKSFRAVKGCTPSQYRKDHL